MWDGKSKDPKVPTNVLLEGKLEPASQRGLKLHCGEAGSETSQAFPLASSASPSASSRWWHTQTEFTNHESWHFFLSFFPYNCPPTNSPLFPSYTVPSLVSLPLLQSTWVPPSEPLTHSASLHLICFSDNILLILALPV